MAKILVVDDDVMVQIILSNLLETEKHEVAIASDGETGLQLVEEIRPNLIICDWMMPGLDGLEVCRRLKANPELAPTFFILLTSRERVSDRVKGLDAGADDFLSKPIEPEELQARVRAGLRLHQLNQRLTEALRDLQSYQAQLVQSEKMSSLGQLVAGIAHEINNPVTFIYSNLNHVQDYTQDLIDLLHLYQQEYQQPNHAIAEKLKAIDWDFLIEDLPKLLTSMQVGADRIRQIVLSLRDFSRLDRSGLQIVDVHACIDNTLFVIQHRLQSPEGESALQTIEVLKDYSELPQIECYAGQLNQALLDILKNAIDALEHTVCKHSLSAVNPPASLDTNLEIAATLIGKPPTIWIRTKRLDESHIGILIADNGLGMDQTVKAQIFDPFFTTKPVGKGTGLGLSICYQIIVQQHGGTLECFSEVGQGTEFLIKLPIHQPSP